MTNFKKFLSILLALILCVSAFVGCDKKDKKPAETTEKVETPVGEGEPKNAAELLEKAAEAMSKLDANFNISMNLNFDATIKAEMEGFKVDMKLPIELTLGFDVANKYVHGNMSMTDGMEMSAEQGSQTTTQKTPFDNVSSEIYVVLNEDEGIVSVYAKEGDIWTVTENNYNDAIEEINPSEDVMTEIEALFNDAEFKKMFESLGIIKEGDNRVVAVKFSDVINNKALNDFADKNLSAEDFPLGLEEIADIGLSEEDLLDILGVVGNMSVKFVFDAEYRLIEVKMDSTKIELAEFIKKLNPELAGQIGMSTDGIEEATIELGFSVKLSKFGEIKEADVKVPDTVIENAVSNGDLPNIDIPEFGL